MEFRAARRTAARPQPQLDAVLAPRDARTLGRDGPQGPAKRVSDLPRPGHVRDAAAAARRRLPGSDHDNRRRRRRPRGLLPGRPQRRSLDQHGRAARSWRRASRLAIRRGDAPPARSLRQRAAPDGQRPRRRRQLDREIRRGGRSGPADRAVRPGQPTPGPSWRRSTARTCTTRPRSCCPTAA